MLSRFLLPLIPTLIINFFVCQSKIGSSYPGLNLNNTPVTQNSIGLGQRHFIIITADTQYLWCSYYFGIHNRSTDDLLFEIPIQLPKNTENFTPQDGLTKEDLHISHNGKISVKKKFKPGINVVSLGFQIPLEIWGDNILKLSFPYTIQEFSVATPKWSTLHLSSPSLEAGVPNMLSNTEYSGLIGTHINSEQTLTIHIQGTPMGNSLSLLVTSISAIFLFSCALLFSLKNHLLLNQHNVQLKKELPSC